MQRNQLKVALFWTFTRKKLIKLFYFFKDQAEKILKIFADEKLEEDFSRNKILEITDKTEAKVEEKISEKISEIKKEYKSLSGF